MGIVRRRSSESGNPEIGAVLRAGKHRVRDTILSMSGFVLFFVAAFLTGPLYLVVFLAGVVVVNVYALTGYRRGWNDANEFHMAMLKQATDGMKRRLEHEINTRAAGSEGKN